ncbi:MAG: YhcH/YjgK/YiaL family protein, partial [Clostridia bacterium]|nr:YhcH/YjgK/YiaL family protein [Clostridia bacterium]
MIFDTLKNMNYYVKMMPQLEEIQKFLLDYMKGEMTMERIDLDGDNLFASPATYVPKDHEGAEYESPVKYADVQVVLKGKEYIGVTPLDT